MSKNDKSRDYTPLLCRLQLSIARQAAEGDARIPCIADLLNIRCHLLANGGKFENARESLLYSELGRGAACLTVELAEVVEAGDAPDFWHWEGDTLVVDAYDPQREKSFLDASRAGRIAGLASAKARKAKSKAASGAGTTVETSVGTSKKVNTTFSSISKAGPSAGAMGPGFDGAATAAEKQPPEARRAREAFATMNPDAE